MGKKGGSAPAAPDAYKTASAEAQFNRVNTYSPSGSGTRYGYTNAQGNFVAGTPPEGSQAAVKSIESPWERQIREALQPASVDLTNRIITDNVTNMPGAARVQDRGTVANDIFDRNFSLMAPAMEKTQSRLLTNLQSRGIPIGSEAFNDAYGSQVRETQDTVSRLAQDANISAGQEQSRLFGLDSAARQNSLSEIVAAMGGGYNPPNATPNGAAPGVNYGGLVGQQYQADTARYNQQQQQGAATAGTIGSLAGAMMMKCTMDAKTIEGFADTEVLASAVMQMPVAVWRYKPEDAPEGFGVEKHVGPMAEHFHALTGMGDGKTISVIDMLGVLSGALQNALRRIEVLERESNQEGFH